VVRIISLSIFLEDLVSLYFDPVEHFQLRDLVDDVADILFLTQTDMQILQSWEETIYLIYEILQILNFEVV
jgi:hypothetical protein